MNTRHDNVFLYYENIYTSKDCIFIDTGPKSYTIENINLNRFTRENGHM